MKYLAATYGAPTSPPCPSAFEKYVKSQKLDYTTQQKDRKRKEKVTKSLESLELSGTCSQEYEMYEIRERHLQFISAKTNLFSCLILKKLKVQNNGFVDFVYRWET
jgi:hypothetical protein